MRFLSGGVTLQLLCGKYNVTSKNGVKKLKKMMVAWFREREEKVQRVESGGNRMPFIEIACM